VQVSDNLRATQEGTVHLRFFMADLLKLHLIRPTSMNVFEVSDDNIVCPFCKSMIIKCFEAEPFRVCPHTVFVATDFGFEYIRDDFKGVVIPEPLGSVDNYTRELAIDGLLLVRYEPAPSFLGTYWGFVAQEQASAYRSG
jgi:hypothetical protein